MYRFEKEIPVAEYDTFVSQHPLTSLLQSAKWAQIKQEWDSVRVGAYDESGQLVATSLILIRKIKGMLKFGYIPRGPILNYQDEELVSFYLKSLKALAKKEGWLFIKFDPKLVLRSAPLREFSSCSDNQEVLAIADRLQAENVHYHGRTTDMIDTLQPRYDATTYLQEHMIDSFDKDVRNKVRRAKNRYVTIRKGGVEDVPQFEKVLQKTMDRKHIYLRQGAYFTHLMEVYGEQATLSFTELNVPRAQQEIQRRLQEIDEQVQSLKGKAPKKIRGLEEESVSLQKSLEELNKIEVEDPNGIAILSGVLEVGYGNTMEMLYIGFDEGYKSYYPQYLIHAEMMEEAYQNGYEKVCMGGVENSLDGGLAFFKSNFNANIEEYIGEFDIITSPLFYPFQLCLYFFKHIRAFLKKNKRG